MSLLSTSRQVCSRGLLNARAVFMLQKECFHGSHPQHVATYSSSTHNQQQQQEQDNTKASSEDDTKHKILETALDFVHVHGWNTQSLAEAARAHGLPGVAHGMFPRGGGDLVHHFVRECNNQLAEGLAAESQEMEVDEEAKRKKKTGAFIRDALETRLRMIIPYADTWPQAMALTALPSNLEDHFRNLTKLMDDIWYYAGDRSTDFNWYTKRGSLAVVYKSTELHLVQDDSEDFQETWLFLDRRLADVATFGKFKTDMDKTCEQLGSFASAAFTTGRNIIGFNERRR